MYIVFPSARPFDSSWSAVLFFMTHMKKWDSHNATLSGNSAQSNNV